MLKVYSFFSLISIPLYVYITKHLSIHLLVDMSNFQFLAITNKAALNSYVSLSVDKSLDFFQINA